jgi:SAM-dependent methyltransferase
LFSDEPACAVTRAFFCGIPVRRDELDSAFGGDILGHLLVEHGEGLWVCPYHVRFVRHLLVVSDHVDGTPDAVMGAGETTAILYEPSRPSSHVNRVLDLGCGAGTLALLLASDATIAVGTDINPRAVALSKLNAEINGIANVEFRCGDLYEPVAGERFDLIVSQPPYYPNARGEATQVYLHGGEHGDEIVRGVIDGVPQLLGEGGKAYVFASLPEGRERFELPGFDVKQIRSPAAEIPGTVQILRIIERINAER